MVAFALRADGWYLRSDIIWAKPNPMPESVTDRPTKAHEYIFLMSKRPAYYYDADSIAEPASDAMQQQIERGYGGLGIKDYEAAGVQNPSSVKARIIEGARKKVGETRNDGQQPHSFHTGKGWMSGLTRNSRTVWSIATQPYPDAHFATFPEAIPERCIKAGSKVGDVVLDPFTGSGTTGAVALRLGREFVGVELNPAYAELARTRIGGAAPLFASEQSA
jgi:DNA modification methylase